MKQDFSFDFDSSGSLEIELSYNPSINLMSIQGDFDGTTVQINNVSQERILILETDDRDGSFP